ncbi:carboxy-S-adenosyl-L-methionine synthase CmoA [Bermanella sp. R86510]|uniref:carboxy-S-adenosyl-L-methionine synthase CmoA n=1 Tax=unclassified Bermanella TaxID=2627862 RepID=UPI0037C6E99D
MARDNIYADEHSALQAFAFDDAVSRVFPDMIKRSVPGYSLIIPMIGVITEQYAQANSNLYDLGCSLGASLLAMRHGVKHQGCKVVGIDNSEAMIHRCESYVDIDNSDVPVELFQGDVTQFNYQNASVITLNFTLQFIDRDKRLALIEQLYESLLPGGVLILSEKVCFEDAQEQSTQQELHWDFKRANGYSDLEISQKRSALENVLVPESAQEQLSRLRHAGFTQAYKWYQCFNFCSFVAIK